LAKPGITALAQLAGRRVGVLTDAYSGQAGVIVRRAIEQAGATATYVGLGTYRKLHEALAAGEIDAAALPIDVRLFEGEERGWTIFTAARMGVPSIVATTRRMVAAERDTVLRVLRGFVETIHLFKTRADVVVPLLQDFLQLDDRGAAARLRDDYASLFPPVPHPALAAGLQELRDLFVGRYPAAQQLQEVDLVDASLIEEIERSGFVAELYGNSVKVG
jgi:hypothetical protein